MLRLLTIILTMMMLGTAAQADIYKCVINGNTTFSQMPCAEDAKKIEVKVHEPSEKDKQSAEKLIGFYESEETSREIQSIEIQNDKLRGEIRRLEKNMDSETETLQLKKSLANNNLAGATWEESLSQEMLAVTEKYRLKIERVTTRIERNERKIEKLETNEF